MWLPSHVWTHLWARSCCPPGYAGPSGLRAIAREGSAVGRGRPVRPAHRAATGCTAATRPTPRAPPSAASSRSSWCPASWPVTAPSALMSPAPARPGLPHLPLHDPRQRRLHPGGVARRSSGASRRSPLKRGPQGHHRRAQPRRPDGPRHRRPPPRPRRRHRHARQPDARARAPPTRSCCSTSTVLIRLQRAGLGRMMGEDCASGTCARESWEQARAPLRRGVAFTSVFSRRDGIVDWRSLPGPAGEDRRGAHQPPRHGVRPGRAGHRDRRAGRQPGPARPASSAGRPGWR